MRRRVSPYWKALAIIAGVLALGNAVATNVLVAAMNPLDSGERILPALGWALVLTALTVLFVLVSTVWLRHGPRSSRWPLALLAFAGPAAAWTIIGLIVGAWLFPLYAFYGLGSGVVAGGVLTLAVRVLTPVGVDPATSGAAHHYTPDGYR